MDPRRLRAVAFAAAIFSCVLSPRLSGACSICLAGDPIFDAQGATAQEQGSVSVYLQLMGWTKRSGVPPGEEEEGDGGVPIEDNESKRLSILGSWTPLDRLTVSLDLPFAFNHVVEREAGLSTRLSASGIGDVASSATVVLWRNRDVLPATWIEGRAFLKFPSGRSHVQTKGVFDKHVQPGTGSWDYGFGLAGTHRLAWATAYTSAFFRINTKGSLDYEYGDVFLWNAALLVPLNHFVSQPGLAHLTPGLELNFRWAQKDVSAGQLYADSGGSILFVTPSLRVALPIFESHRNPSLRAAVQVPVTSAWLNGFQQENVVWSVGLFFPL